MDPYPLNQPKKKRSANFTNNEKLLLIQTVHKYKYLVENKKTDNVTTAEKNEVWKKITEEFNSSGVLCPRDTECLKRAYDNRKKLFRKSAAEQKRELYKTEGGPPTYTKKTPGDELLLAIVDEKTVHGLSTCFGGDSDHTAVFPPTESIAKLNTPRQMVSVDDNIEIIFENSEDDGEDQDNQQNITFDENFQKNLSGRDSTDVNNSTQTGNLLSEDLDVNSMVDGGIQTTDKTPNSRNSWKRYKIGDLKTQPSQPLLPQSCKVGASPSVDFARRRPRTVVKALTTSEISEKYNKLLDERLEVAKFQKELLKNRIEYEKVEHNLKVQALQKK